MSNRVNNLIADAKIISEDVSATFGDLSAVQINWKPIENEWSVGQCFDHLITTNDLYMANIQKVADGTHENNLYSKIPFFTDFVGKRIKKAVSPDSKKKVKTFPIFEAKGSAIAETIIEDFGEKQWKLISLMEAVKKNLDPSKIKIVTPISVVINVRLTDAFEILVKHERRHFGQAKRVMESARFPV